MKFVNVIWIDHIQQATIAYPYLGKFLEKLGHGRRRRDASFMLTYLESNQ